MVSWPYAFGQRILVVAAYGSNRSLLLSGWKQRGDAFLPLLLFLFTPSLGHGTANNQGLSSLAQLINSRTSVIDIPGMCLPGLILNPILAMQVNHHVRIWIWTILSLV